MLHVTPEDLLVDSFRLGRKVYETGFRPKHAISIWRGGTPVGLGVDAYFRMQGVFIQHTTIATASYKGVGRRGEVIVKNLEHLVEVVSPEDDLLIIDDVYESGRTIQEIVELLRRRARANTPRRILVAALHEKPEKREYDELPVVALHRVPAETWIDYPHELADLLEPDDPEDRRIREKDPEIWKILHAPPSEPRVREGDGPYRYLSPRQLLLDCVQLGVNIAHDRDFRPDYLIALWPAGVLAGLPVHEVYKYFLARGGSCERAPDHISLNTSPTRRSFRNQVVGLRYLEERIGPDDNLLIIDTTFRAGRLVNDVVNRLKEVLRRNLNHKRIRVATVYYNPDDRSTWTVRPDIRQPHYYLERVNQEIIDPTRVHALRDPRRELRRLNPELWEVLYG